VRFRRGGSPRTGDSFSLTEIDAVAPKRAEVTGEVEIRVLWRNCQPDGRIVAARPRDRHWRTKPSRKCWIPRCGVTAGSIAKSEIGVPNTQAAAALLRDSILGDAACAGVDLPEIAELSHGLWARTWRRSARGRDDCACADSWRACRLDRWGCIRRTWVVQVTARILAGLKDVEPRRPRILHREQRNGVCIARAA